MTTAMAAGEYVTSRRVGDATVSVINEGTLYWAPELTAPEEEWRRAIPEADAEGRIPIDFHVVRVWLGGASILVDAGFDDPASSWGRRLVADWPGVRRTPGLTAGLATLGIRPEEITHVVITHAHGDHVIGLTVERDGRHVLRFPNAQGLLGRADWEGNEEQQNPESEVAIRLGTVERAGSLELVDGDREVVPGVTMIHAPGESPGHSIVRVSSRGERFYALGDLFHHVCEIEHPEWSTPWVDKAAERESRERLLHEAAASRAMLVFTHHPFPPWGRLVRADKTYQWEQT